MYVVHVVASGKDVVGYLCQGFANADSVESVAVAECPVAQDSD